MLTLPPFPDDALRRRIRELSAADEEDCVAALLADADPALGDGAQTAALAAELVDAIRNRQRYQASINALLTEYSLSSREGVVLMCLAEALLRVPDQITADRLIRDKLGDGDWRAHIGNSQSVFVNASAWGLLLTGEFIRLRRDETDSAWQVLRRAIARAGEPAIRAAMRLAMRIMGTQFVLGSDIDAALEKSAEWLARGYCYSYDMLGEAARTGAYAHDYFLSYCSAMETVGSRARAPDPARGPGFSVKLSALHPRLELAKWARLEAELIPRVLELARIARRHNLGLSIDAEEAHRLEITLHVFERVFGDSSLRGWDGFGLAVQSYLKNAPAVIDWLGQQAARHGRRIMVRLVKGAYWDAEIKFAQLMGYDRYPVFTRKASSDVSYLVCAKKLLDARQGLYPQFATHNAHSAAAILAMSGTTEGFEFQRLHGMGEELFEELIEERESGASCRIYAPVGVHRDLLAYLVRRLLENGANSSFVHNLADPSLSSEALAADPRLKLKRVARLANGNIRLPPDLFGPERRNSRGIDLAAVDALIRLQQALARWNASLAPIASMPPPPGTIRVRNPARHDETIGHYRPSDATDIEAALERVHGAAAAWSATPVAERAACLRRAADRLEAAMEELVGYCVKEAGKTLRDAIADVREAIDFCRYYAAEAESLFARHGGDIEARGAMLCISPWNFPAAIFVGQLSAALVAGNTVVAKPSEQTTLIALRIHALFLEAGIPPDALVLLLGPGEPVGERALGDSRLAGVMFTGSTEVARLIARRLAGRGGARAALVAETGGQNALVVDSTALLEQVVDDVIASGFNSAGQRCSALRVLYVQHDVADRLISMLTGAMGELTIGDPSELATDIGPIIDEQAVSALEAHRRRLDVEGRLLCACDVPAADGGSWFAPRLYEIDAIDRLGSEVFGPVVHLIRYRADELDALPERINSTGYALTFGIHSRIQSTIDLLSKRVRAGNVYVNRNIIGAVVGVQPFGGRGLSGTGPKAGGPHYIARLVRHRDASAFPYRPLPRHRGAEPIGEAFDCGPLIDALREMQAPWAESDAHRRLQPARRLCEQLARDTLIDHDARETMLRRIRSLIEQAEALGRGIEMPGPTGESNALQFEARGVLVCLLREDPGREISLPPALAALMAGNAVLFLSDPASRTTVRELRNRLAEAGFPDTLSAHHPATTVEDMGAVLSGCAIDGAICHGDPAFAEYASRALARRTGAILPLIDEPPGPLYLQRFVHEKTLSVNITAAGGNAALMSQSESD